MHRGTSICPSTSLKGGNNDADSAVIRRGKGGTGFLSNKLGKHNEKTQEVAERGNCGANNVQKIGYRVLQCRRAFAKKRERGAKTGSISNLILMSQHKRFTTEPKGSLARPHPPPRTHSRYTNAGSGGPKRTSLPSACKVMNSLCPETPPPTNC